MTVKIKHETIKIDAKNSEALLRTLAAPVRFNDMLTAAFKEHAQRVTSR